MTRSRQAWVHAWCTMIWEMPCTLCKVLYVGNYPNPSFGHFAEVCCSITGVFKFLMHSGYGIFDLLSISTYFHGFVPIFTHMLRCGPSSWGCGLPHF